MNGRNNIWLIANNCGMNLTVGQRALGRRILIINQHIFSLKIM